MEKAPDAFRTISEVSDWLETPTHVLRFWESRFPEVAPVKRAGGRRYYRVDDVRLLGGIKKLLHEEGVSIKALQDRIKADGAESVAALSPALEGLNQGIEEMPSDDSDGGEIPAEEAEAPAASLPSRRTARPASARAAGDGAAPAARPAPRQRSLSLGDAPAPATGDSDGGGVSFRRHPSRSKPAKATPPPATRSHPTRQGLFLYDDSETHKASAPSDEPESPAPDAPVLAPIDHVPADIEDDCAAPMPLPSAAEFRALAALAAGALPMEAVNALSRLRALDTRWR